MLSYILSLFISNISIIEVANLYNEIYSIFTVHFSSIDNVFLPTK
jgi:hypothetical protein